MCRAQNSQIVEAREAANRLHLISDKRQGEEYESERMINQRDEIISGLGSSVVFRLKTPAELKTALTLKTDNRLAELRYQIKGLVCDNNNKPGKG